MRISGTREFVYHRAKPKLFKKTLPARKIMENSKPHQWKKNTFNNERRCDVFALMVTDFVGNDGRNFFHSTFAGEACRRAQYGGNSPDQ
jgi:hypothetical protein